MRVMFGLVLAAMVSYTCLVEDTDILLTKLALRCLLYSFSVLSFHLWASGMGWKGTLAHLAAILLILCTDDSKPNNAAPLLLCYVSIAILTFFITYNPHSHVRQLTTPFHVLGHVQDGPLFHNFYQDVVDYSSATDSEDSDAEHWPPGLEFLDGDFILGPLPQNEAVIAG